MTWGESRQPLPCGRADRKLHDIADSHYSSRRIGNGGLLPNRRPTRLGPAVNISPGGGASFFDMSGARRALEIGAIQRSQFGDGSADGFVKRLPCVGSLHAQQHEVSDVREAEQAFRVSGESFRDCG